MRQAWQGRFVRSRPSQRSLTRKRSLAQTPRLVRAPGRARRTHSMLRSSLWGAAAAIRASGPPYSRMARKLRLAAFGS